MKKINRALYWQILLPHKIAYCVVPGPTTPPPPLIWCYFYGPSFKNWRKIKNGLLIEHNKLILFLSLMISVNYEKIQIFFEFTGNASFVFIIANQKFYWASGNTELLQLDLR